jgi:hypothetical protein
MILFLELRLSPVLSDVGAKTVETRKGNLKNKIHTNSLHQILSHCGERSARYTGKALVMMLLEILIPVRYVPLEKHDKRLLIKTGQEVVSFLVSDVMLTEVQFREFGV